MMEEHEGLRVPPHSIEAEQSVIGGLFLDSDTFEDIRGIVKEADFYRQDHRLIFRAQTKVLEQDGQFDVITLSAWLKDKDCLKQAGGLAYLGTLAKDTPSSANIVNYAKIVAQKSRYRTLIALGTELSSDAYESEQEPSELIQTISNQFDDVLQDQCGDTQVMKDLHQDTMEMIEGYVATREEKGFVGVPTGLPTIDKLLGGFLPAKFYIVGGRPGSGKTALLNQAAIYGSMNGYPVGMINLEMPKKELVLRMMAHFYKVNNTALNFGNQYEFVRLKRAIQENKDLGKPLLEDAQLFVEQGLSNIDSICAKITQWVRKNGVRVVILDYIQLVEIVGENKAIGIGEISRRLKLLANSLNVSIVALAQLNRECEKHNRRPEPSDLKDSGALEQDADCIIFVHFDKAKVFDTHKPMDIGFSKVRFGSPGWVEGIGHESPFTFEGKTQTFRESDEDMYSDRYKDM